MSTPKTLLCALMLVFSVVRPVAATDQTALYGGIGRGSPLNHGALITINQGTGAGTLVGHPDSVPGLSGLVFDISGNLYGTTISGTLGTGRFSTLVHIDPGTGAQIGPAMTVTANGQPISITDLAVQPGTNTLYGTSLSEEDFINSIYTIDPATGVATLIGRTGVIGATLAFGPDGTLYQTSAIFDADGFVAGYLNTLDPDTAAVLTTSNPFTQAHVGGLAVRPTDGVIFASGGDEGDIYTLSPTGTQTLVGFTGVGGVGDLAFTPLPTSKDQCKNGGWLRFNFPFSFKNQGDCIQFVNTGK
jgi:sugar lactone lactonase YvrE